MSTIYDVLRENGYASRPNTEFADNFDRHFKIDSGDGIVTIVVTKRVENLTLSAKYAFNLNDRTTTATSEEVGELQRILEIKPFVSV